MLQHLNSITIITLDTKIELSELREEKYKIEVKSPNSELYNEDGDKNPKSQLE